MRLTGGLLAVSLLTTEILLAAESRMAEMLPLHLCSVAAIVALHLAYAKRQAALDFLGYLGMPGALLALLFPAPAVSRCQGLLNASYMVTHALIIVIPAWRMCKGMRVREGQEMQMLLLLHGLALAAYTANLLLGTDYLFLVAPPAGTPLCIPYAYGRGWYLLALEALACAMIALTGRLIPRFFPPVMQ